MLQSGMPARQSRVGPCPYAGITRGPVQLPEDCLPYAKMSKRPFECSLDACVSLDTYGVLSVVAATRVSEASVSFRARRGRSGDATCLPDCVLKCNRDTDVTYGSWMPASWRSASWRPASLPHQRHVVAVQWCSGHITGLPHTLLPATLHKAFRTARRRDAHLAWPPVHFQAA